jgi:septal ring factor EnvC (AmiA/AmiB activator)
MGLGRITVGLGQVVKKGDLVGYMPDIDSPKLTLELRYKSDIKDPRSYLAQEVLKELKNENK